MIHLLVALSPAAAATWTVTRTDDLSVSGTLRYALTHAAANDTITFSTTQFPPGSVTAVTITQALPTLGLSGLVLDGGGRAEIACAAAMANGSGLLVTGADVTIRDLVVADCPQHGIQVTALRTVVERTELRGNDAFGILVVGADTVAADVELSENTLVGNCAATTATCAGIGVRRGGVGAGPHAVSIHNNTIDGTSSGGHGIALLGGVDHLVATNEIGLGGGNAGHGVLCAANSGQWADATIVWNTIGHNAQNGIQLGLRCEPSQVGTNQVGVDGVTDVGNGLAGIELFGSDGHHLLGNVVGFNTTGGVLVNGTLNGNPAEDAILEDNLVGLCADGVTPAPNTGDGIRLDGPAGTFVDHLLDGNVVGTNTGHGVRIDARGVTLHANLVGVSSSGHRRGNGVVGVWVGAAGDDVDVDGCPTPTTCAPNVLGDNGTTGISVQGADARIVDNVVGWGPGGGAARGNGGDGIWIAGGADRASVRRNVIGNNGEDGIAVDPSGGTVAAVVLRANTITDNVGRGISATAGASTVEWSENEVADNGSCPYLLDASVNAAVDDVRPIVGSVTPVSVQGTFSAGSSGRTLDHIEVFVDAGTEMGRYLGAVGVGGDLWRLELGDAEPLIPTTGRVTAIAVFQGGESSHPEEWCQDGCDLPGPASCNDGSPCTTDTCQVSGCTHGATNGGGACEDGNACTLADTCAGGECQPGTTFAAQDTPCTDADPCSWEAACTDDGTCKPASKVACDDGNSCTADDDACDPDVGCAASVDRPSGFHCEDGNLCLLGDTCDGQGQCQAGTEPYVCPDQTNCNTCSCDPDTGCSCAGIDDDICGPDDLDVDANGLLLMDDCEGGNPNNWDRDGDGFPNVWEDEGADLDCDGQNDDVTAEEFTANRDLFWEIDHMAAADGHDHTPPPTNEEFVTGLGLPGAPLEAIFDRWNIELHVDASGPPIPHVEVTTFGGYRYPRYGEPEWTTYRELRAEHFDSAHRRGVYSYVVLVHAIQESDPSVNGLGGMRGDSAIVGLRNGGTDWAKARALVHEKGHNLGLKHGGFEGRNDKPNYLSRMNYSVRELLNVQDDRWYLDYSWYERPDQGAPAGTPILRDLTETAITEVNGYFSSSTPVERLYAATWRCPGAPPEWAFAPIHADVPGPLTTTHRRVDFDCDGLYGESGYAQDLNGDGLVDPVTTQSHWDWGHLFFAFQHHDGFHREEQEDGSEETGSSTTSWRPIEVSLTPGCATAQVPRGAAGWDVPLVVWGDADLDVTEVTGLRLGGALASATTTLDLDADGHQDLYSRFATADLTRLATGAVHVTAYGERADGLRLMADVPITRPLNPPDGDGDGVHDACDVCPLMGDPPGGMVGPDGCP